MKQEEKQLLDFISEMILERIKKRVEKKELKIIEN